MPAVVWPKCWPMQAKLCPTRKASEEELEEWVIIEEKLFYLEPIIRFMALFHSLVSFCMLIAYYHLKVPLAIFKREKEVARAMEFDGLYITEEPAEDDVRARWDKLVISTKSFPVNYWDKFVKKRVRQKYSETYDPEALSNVLGMDKSGSISQEKDEASGLFPFITNVDWKYQIWKSGVTITDNSFLYNLWYFTFSVMGNLNYFFFAAHLLDVAVGFKTLRTILQSVTHNGKQLVLTVMLLTIIVYIYTVIAFSFFRKFYIQEEDDQVDHKCNSMLTCFVFHLYKGVRAGGGIGDEIEPPDGDDYEVYRIIFDITFFFFVIVILLAIIQGLIIDAFGELRDQLQSVVDDMESNCFICGIGKDYFDRVPHGFDTHVQKEHNLANYMFFLMHLINKPDTEYTGQETFVWELYQKRCWDFFPVGDCFRKQYEDELMGAG
ncbi:ryanodine receptor-like [Dermacentor silvarum]|uniref:ryanodine receptor-like n=1 Tax=Dermacentor silvarum TaxID=543639 RepID=UPI001898C745|nr:ryanodine receptor-like [Dermacentor silvarum]